MKPVCLITGAGGLLGNALCDELSEEYNVVATFRSSVPKHSSQLVKKISSKITNDIYCVQGDLTKKEDIRRIVDVTVAKFGQIDVVINNAVDYNRQGKLLELYHADDYATSKLTMNTVVPFQLVSYIHQNCWKNSPKENLTWNRNVLNISSMAGIKFYSTSEAFYSASKSAMNMLTLHLAWELESYRIRVNALCPPGFDANGAKFLAVKSKHVIQGADSGSLITDLYN